MSYSLGIDTAQVTRARHDGRRHATAAGMMLVTSVAFYGTAVRAQTTRSAPPTPNPAAAADSSDTAFVMSEAMIPTRDSVHLHTLIFVPRHAQGDLPIILTRTPYGIAGSSRALSTAYKDLADDGYIFVMQDIRGRFASEGAFVMLRPMRDKSDPRAIDESTDTYDTIDWLLKHIPHNNGRVGMLGVSYPGWLTVMAMLDPHPALKTVSPQASPADMFLGDDFHHNGAFRLSYAFEYVAMMERSKEFSEFDFTNPDTYQWYLSLGSLSHGRAELTRKMGKGGDAGERRDVAPVGGVDHRVPTWTNFVTHAAYDSFWQNQAVVPHIDRVTVPTLNVSGWWDQEDFYGAITIYEALAQHDPNHLNYLVVGPWNHGGWDAPTGEKFGPIDFGSQTSLYYRKSIQAPWFAYWLKDKGKLTLGPVTTFESGDNRWRTFQSWPPRQDVTARKLYFHADRQLSFETPSGQGAASSFDSYVSDPANPVPYRKRPIPSTFTPRSGWPTWLYSDQRFVQDRRDVLSYETAPLANEVTIAGNITAHLAASTTGTDADWIVKLIDVYPERGATGAPADTALDGYELMVANDVFRGRFRKSYAHPEAIPANRIEPYTVDLHTQNYRFLKGHRIMVQVQSTWFPLIDRNPQTFVPNIFEANDSDFRAATERIYRSAENPSYVELSVLGASVEASR